MALNASKIPSSGGNFKRPPALDAGTYPARLVQIIDLGVQEQDDYMGKEKPPKQELYTTYECLDEFLIDEDGKEIEDKPRWLSENFTLNSLDSDMAKSTKRYLALDPLQEYSGDWAALIGTTAMITISAKPSKAGKKDSDGNVIIYNNITSVSSMREKDAKKAEPLKNPPKVFDMDEPDLEVFLSLPDWLRDKIKGALNFGGGALEKALSEIDEDSEVKKRREKRQEEAQKASKESEGGSTKMDDKASQQAADDASDDDGEDW